MPDTNEKRERGALVSIVFPALYAIAASILFGVLAYAAHQNPVLPGDLGFTRAVQLLRNPAFDAVSRAVLWSGLPPQSQYIFGFYAIALFVIGLRWAALVETAAAAGSAVLYFYFEPLVSRPRPSPDLVYVASAITMGSFPSGHSLIFFSVYGFLVYLALRTIRHPVRRRVAALIPTLVVVAVGFSRIYDGQHWLTDVIGGWLLGSVYLTVLISVYRAGLALTEILLDKLRAKRGVAPSGQIQSVESLNGG